MNPAEHSLSTLSCDSAVFISDLHLSNHTPQLIKRFERFCSGINAQWLIVLGDLFEGYSGDDDRSECIAAVDAAFAGLHRRGVRVAIMHGNRDFLMGHGFTTRNHAVLLNDPCILNESILLSHGDRWCTLDTGYQAWRKTSRSLEWQNNFLLQSLAIRQAQIQAYRAQSKAAQMDVLSSTTDVVDRDVLLEANELECSTVLHGHTHRPSDRLLHTDAKRDVRKVVLGDWDEVDEADGAQERTVSCARYQDGALTTFLV